jgi:hypothetical protein
VTHDSTVPATLTLEEAFRAAYFMADQYVALESSPDDWLVLFLQYLHSDPARRDDWNNAVRQALRADPESVSLD